MSRRLLFVHAHPDDESSKGAATAARYVDEGAEVVLVTCTGGEAGDVLNPSAPPVPDGEMPAVRARELAEAVAAIGFTRTHRLGYHDSGYHEDPSTVPEGTFGRTPVEAPAADLAAILRRERPHVVVTYPEDGGYPHPDHIMVHEVTVRAVDLAASTGDDGAGPWDVPKLYATASFPAIRINALHEAMLERGLESPYAGWIDARAERERAEDREPPSTWVDVGAWFHRRDRALLAHVSQIDPDGAWFHLPRDVEREVFPYECYHLLRGEPAPDGDHETDLFAGLDVG